MEIIIVSGYVCNLTKKQTSTGKEFMQFSIAVDKGQDQKTGSKETKWWTCTSFSTGMKWDTIARKGNKLCVIGRVVKDGLMNVIDTNIIHWGAKQEDTTHTDTTTSNTTEPSFEEDIPF